MGVVVGIDPGLGGAICFLDEASGSLSLWDMPVHEGRRSGDTEVDYERLHSILTMVCPRTPRLLVIEDVFGRPGQGGKSMFTFGAAYGAAISACAASRIRTVRVLPKVWQFQILGPFTAGDSKDASRAWALANHPRDLFIRGAGKKPDHNRTDAAAIATYGSRTFPEPCTPNYAA